jgi:hypothetical protein
MLFLLAGLVFAQEPPVFDPVPVDHDTGEEVLEGILVDEVTYKELIQLRTDTTTFQQEISSFEAWKAQEDKRFTESLGAVQGTCEEGQTRLVDHYEEALKKEKRKDFLQRHGFSIGVAAGLVGATALYLGATRFYGEVLTFEVAR